MANVTAAALACKLSRAMDAAKRRNEPMAVCTIDEADERRLCIFALSSTNYAEFEAFDGRILAVVYPDGDIDHGRDHSQPPAPAFRVGYAGALVRPYAHVTREG